MPNGSITKRGNYWYVRWRDPSGQQRKKSLGTRKKDAVAYLAKIQASMIDGTYQNIEKIAFSTFVELWMENYAVIHTKPSTLYNYRSMLDSSLIPYFQDMPLARITSSEVQKYLKHKLATGVKSVTATKSLTLLKGMLTQAVEWDYLKINPAASVKPPRQESTEVEPLDIEQIKDFLGVLDGQWHAFFFTLIFTGMRLGEVRALKWSDIDWDNHSIRVQRSIWRGEFQTPKTKKSIRNIGMSPKLAKVLLEHQKKCPSSHYDLVFCSESGEVLDDSNIRKRVFKPALKLAGLGDKRIHDLRHTYASLLIHQGENIQYVKEQLGHESITTTVDRYSHLMPNVHIEASRKLDSTVFG